MTNLGSDLYEAQRRVWKRMKNIDVNEFLQVDSITLNNHLITFEAYMLVTNMKKIAQVNKVNKQNTHIRRNKTEIVSEKEYNIHLKGKSHYNYLYLKKGKENNLNITRY